MTWRQSVFRWVPNHLPSEPLAPHRNRQSNAILSPWWRSGAVRLKELDILRGVAVLLVLACHCRASEFLLRSGWVDLFFVLSGFLVSGLLFVEHQRTGRIRIWRFFARRGFKIYPAFYFFIGLTLLFNALHSKPPEISSLIRELVFIQNYGPAIWPHTW